MKNLNEGFIIVSLLFITVIGSLPTFAEKENLTEKVIALEQNLTNVERRLDVAMTRTANLLTSVEELENTVKHLKANLSRVSRFALPSAPPDFRVESIGRDPGGNYSVTLRWKNNPEYEGVQKYVIWFASKGFPYLPVKTVNSTEGIMRVKVPGFIKGHDIVFKIFGRNEAGQGEPAYREVKIRGYAPFLMSRLRTALLIVVLMILIGVAWWKFPRRTDSDGE